MHCRPHAVRLAESVDCPVQAFRVGVNVYATQFHPDTADGLKHAARQRDERHPPLILRRFAERFARRA